MMKYSKVFRTLGIFILLLGVSLLAYSCYPIPIIFGYYFQVSSMFMILAITLLGRKNSIALALIFGVIIWGLFKEPFIVWVLVGEIIFLSLCYNNQRRGSFLLIDVIYWLSLGIPAVLILIHMETGRLETNSILLILTLIVNSLTNALLAEVLLTYIPAFSLMKQKRRSITLHRILSNVAIVSVTLPFVVFAIIMGWYQSDMIVQRASKLTTSIAAGIEGQLQGWNSEDYNLLRLHSIVQLGRLQDITDKYVENDKSVRIIIADSEGYKLTETGEDEQHEDIHTWTEIGSQYKAQNNLYLWLPKSSRYYPSSDWNNSFFIHEAPVSNQFLTIHIEVPFPYFAKDIYYIYTVNFAFILGSILVAALVCFIISKLIVRHLMKLIHSTVNLPEEVRKNRALNIMDSPIYEFSWLKKNFDHIVYKLSVMFTESEEMNKSLEEKTVELIESEERLRKLAFTDSLTQLPNRHYFMKFLQYLESTTQPDSSEITALLFIDLDKFKEVNDSLGHDAGDDLLRYVATTLTMVVDYGTVYRLAGDEFVIIINDTSKQEVDQTCEKLLLAFESPILIKNQPCEVNLSIGVALHPIDGLNFSHILNLSDRAMYKAKEGGGGSFVYYSDLHQKPEWM